MLGQSPGGILGRKAYGRIDAEPVRNHLGIDNGRILRKRAEGRAHASIAPVLRKRWCQDSALLRNEGDCRL